MSLGATDARLSFIEGTGVEDRRVVVDASVAALNDALGVVTWTRRVRARQRHDFRRGRRRRLLWFGRGGRRTVEVSIVRR